MTTRDAVRKTILLIDDSVEQLAIASNVLADDYRVIAATGGEAGLRRAREARPDLILLDVMMPGLSGYEVCRRLKADATTRHIPVIFVTSLDSAPDEAKGFEVGAVDYIVKRISPAVVLARVASHLELARLRGHLEEQVHQRTAELEDERALLRSLLDSIPDLIFYKDPNGVYLGCNRAFEEYVGKAETEIVGHRDADLVPGTYADARQVPLEAGQTGPSEGWLYYPDGRRVLMETLKTPLRGLQGEVRGLIGISRDITERWQADEERRAHMVRLQQSLEQTIIAIGAAIEKRDPYTAGHQHRVAELGYAIAKELELDEETASGVRLGGFIHDLGQLYVPSEILNRPGPVSEVELAFIREHPKVGYEIVREIEFPWPIAQMLLQHHERLDGSGYPQGLVGDEIILQARIIAVADVVEAMASNRPYRPACELEEALAEIERHAGILYDAQVVEACLKLFRNRGYALTPLAYGLA